MALFQKSPIYFCTQWEKREEAELRTRSHWRAYTVQTRSHRLQQGQKITLQGQLSLAPYELCSITCKCAGGSM